MSMNRKLLIKVRDRIVARPRQFVMENLFSTETDLGEAASHCGTAACIAGWAIVFAVKFKNPEEASRSFNTSFDARRALKISSREACSLFAVACWPVRFKREFEKAQTSKEQADVARRRINY